VLLHGFSDNLQTWRRVVPALAVEHRVVAIDLPGHGATTRPFEAPLLNGYRRPDERHRQLDGRGRGRCAAAAHPERVDSVVLIGMPGLTGVPLAWRAAA
jgi:pimeloyl-ACP methyl ester carboxylesterase